MGKKITGKDEGINFFDTGLLIGIITALGYFSAYAYQKGFWLYYGVTQEFLNQISIVNILVSMSVVGFGIGSLILHYKNMKGSLSRSNHPVIQILQRFVLPFLFICITGLVLIPSNILKIQPVHLLYIFLFLLIIAYVPPIFSHWQVKGYKNKLIKQIEHLDKQQDVFTVENIVLKYKEFPSIRLIYLFVVFVACFGISFSWGYKSAVEKENYLVFDVNGEKFLVIDRNGDNFLVTQVNLEKKEINQIFQIIEIKSDIDKPIFFNHVKIEDGIMVNNSPQF